LSFVGGGGGGGGVGKTASVCVQLSFVRRRTCLLLWNRKPFQITYENFSSKVL
jgi:hypothetical protein